MRDGAGLENVMYETVRPRAREWRCFLFVAALGVAADSAAKTLSRRRSLGSVRHLVGPLSLRHVENPGIEVSYLAGGHVIPIVIGLVILALVVCFSAWGGIHFAFPAACGVAVAGCTGNLLDRLADGRVTDFVAVWHLPVFNFADVFLVLGFIVMIAVSVAVDLSEGRSVQKRLDGSRDSQSSGSGLVAEVAPRFLAREVHR